MPVTIKKTPTGIDGLDEVLLGGVPAGRITLVCGSAGCGKSLMALQFLSHGALHCQEPGVLVSFEESAPACIANGASIGIHLQELLDQQLLVIDQVEPAAGAEFIGEYDLEGLFVRLDHAISKVHARRVVLDTPEALVGARWEPALVRSEFHRLFSALRQRGVTALVTGEQGIRALTRFGLEEYIADCVISLRQEVNLGSMSRLLQIVKYRGSSHGTNVYPFLIGDEGFSVSPITSLNLDYPAPSERISSGVEDLDDLFGASPAERGIFRGSTVLISGSVGSGKSSLAAAWTEALANAGKRVLYMSFEESPAQIIRNMRSINIQLAPLVERRLLEIRSLRPSALGLEAHLSAMKAECVALEPDLVVVDPLTAFQEFGPQLQARSLLARYFDFLKLRSITGIFLALLDPEEGNHSAVSSLIDTWIHLAFHAAHGERNRLLTVLKSRGTPCSNQQREFELSSQGIRLLPTYRGADGLVTGTARAVQEHRDREEAMRLRDAVSAQQGRLARQRALMEAQLEVTRATLQDGVDDLVAELRRTESTLASFGSGQTVAAQHRSMGSRVEVVAPSPPLPTEPTS
jgi:circadian clock protein KaiC